MLLLYSTCRSTMCNSPLLHCILGVSIPTPLNVTWLPSPIILISFPFSVFIESLFAAGEVSEIWITFADPQIGREKKRLTAPLFMNRYRNFLKPGGIVHLKTDSRYLHEYSRAMAEQNGLKVLACATDIYGADRERLYESGLSSLCGRDAVDALFEVQTFYESQYLAQGIQITYLSFLADHEGAYISPEWDEDTWKDENHHFVIASGLSVASKFYPEA